MTGSAGKRKRSLSYNLTPPVQLADQPKPPLQVEHNAREHGLELRSDENHAHDAELEMRPSSRRGRSYSKLKRRHACATTFNLPFVQTITFVNLHNGY